MRRSLALRKHIRKVLSVFPANASNYVLLTDNDGYEEEEFWTNEYLINRYLKSDMKLDKDKYVYFSPNSHIDMNNHILTGSILIINIKIEIKSHTINMHHGSMIKKDNYYTITRVENGETETASYFEEDLMKWYEKNSKNVIFVRVQKPCILTKYDKEFYLHKFM